MRGLIEALDIRAAREKLSWRGILAENIAPAGVVAGRRGRKKKFKTSSRDVFYHETSTLLDAGIPLTRALDVLIESPETEELGPLIAGVRDSIKDGGSFSAALESSGAYFSPFELAAINAGEQSGALADVCLRLGGFFARRHRIMESLRTAMIYPIIVLIFCFVVAEGMLGFMLTKFEQVWIDAGIELPKLTSLVMWIGRWGVIIIPLLLVLAVLAFLRLRRRIETSEEVRVRWHRRFFKVPLMKKVYTALVNLRFAGTLSLLIKGGVQIADAIPVAGRATGNAWVEQMLNEKCELIRHGITLADAIRQIPPLAGALPGWIRAGEESGDMVNMLEKADQRYELQFEQSLERALRVVEPMILLFVGLIVFIIAIAILLPVLTVNRGVVG